MTTYEQALTAYQDLKAVPDRAAAIARAFGVERDKIASAGQWSESYKAEQIVALRDKTLAELNALHERARSLAATIRAFEPGPLGDPDPVVRELRTSRAWDRVKAASGAGQNLSTMISRASAKREAEVFAALLEFAGDDQVDMRNDVVKGIIATFPDHDWAKQAALIEWADLWFNLASHEMYSATSQVGGGRVLADDLRDRTNSLTFMMGRRRLTDDLGIPEPGAA